ncbi:hypothetical protein DFH94DRAFT_686819 [Russula ochroleuca]|uniref:Uncharacterized protein n=1 Tax=Russula ochroleuca TaxID=152965 RepID=A0A9P5JTJ5_9AGAM|nr:hypothetical protein DFH94DRAFT_686819 [Russula ochroleuca]
MYSYCGLVLCALQHPHRPAHTANRTMPLLAPPALEAPIAQLEKPRAYTLKEEALRVRFPALLSGGGGTAAARGGGEGVGGSRGRVGHRMSRTKRVKVESHSRACLESEDEVGMSDAIYMKATAITSFL